MDFETKEVKFTMDEKGRVTDILPYERNLAHKMIEEFMILANETVAEFAFHCEIPFVYRVHEKPDAEKLTDLNSFLNGFGLGIKEKLDNVRSATLQKVLDEAEKTPYSNIVSKVMLRSMQKQNIIIKIWGTSDLPASVIATLLRRYAAIRTLSYTALSKICLKAE